ncbi:MAG: DUF4153 domain-containing protein [Cellvibrionaceae bacterium]|nr:DUF4153 domain-containing protein [Cellvibrionaceae bacterium]
MEHNSALPSKLLVFIALLQGFCLLYLHQAIELGYWPNKQHQWLLAFYGMALTLPVMLLLSITANNKAAILKYSLPFSLLSGLLGYYTGNQALPVGYIGYNGLLFAYALTMSLATFKALMYIQQLAAGERISYTSLFRWSWRNFLTLSLSLLFAGCFWLILVLWGALFKAINIDFFKTLFEEPWFYYPAIALANGFGVIIFRRLTPIIDTITRLQQALMKFLLILIILISLLFLCALPFTGLAPLWESGGSALILWMQALILFFVNAVYQDDPQQRPYSRWLHRFVYIGVALLPIYSALSFYGLSLRVDQYGWSLARCWAFLIWFLLALFPLGYGWGIAKKRDDWVIQLSRVNVIVGLVALSIMLLINSPLLDFRKIVTNNQLQRLANNEITLDDLDIAYFRYELAKPGYNAIQQIKTQYADTHPEMIVRINQFYSDNTNDLPSSTQEEFIAAIELLSKDPPPALLEAIYHYASQQSWELQNTQKYYLQTLDLNEDAQTEYLFVSQYRHGIYTTLYYFESNEWKTSDMITMDIVKDEAQTSFIEALKAGELQVKPPKWHYVEIDGIEFRVEGYHN